MAKKPKEDDLIPIIVPAGAEVKQRRKADEGGEEQSMREAVAGFFGVGRRSVADVREQMTKIVGHIEEIISSIKATPVGEMELSGIDIGLTISASGDIGIASAGVEASMTLSFSRPKAEG